MYTGNGNTDGPFVYTGFKPAKVVEKEQELLITGANVGTIKERHFIM